MPHSVRSTASRQHHHSSSKPSSSELNYSHGRKLSLPRDGASPKTWARLCHELTLLAMGGYSLAVALGEDIDASVSSATYLADPLFTPTERDMYAAFKKGKPVPRVDWHRLHEPLSGNTSAQRARWNDLTDALRSMYADSSISRENCKAWLEKYQELTPLLIACKKVETARHDAKPAKNSSKVRRDVHELIACRSLISEIGKQRVRSNTAMKTMNKEATERETDLTKRLARVNASAPYDREDATKRFSAREAYFAKLTKIRVDRVEAAAEVSRQNIELTTAENALKNRMASIEERMRRLRS